MTKEKTNVTKHNNLREISVNKIALKTNILKKN